jgi:beta-N-acetylhexosaminidase
MVHLSTTQSAGQVIVAGFGAGDIPEPLADLARQGALGGFILFRRNLGSPAEIVNLIERLLALAPADLPLWMAVDQEGGRVARLGPPVLRLPPMRELGAIDDPALTEQAALLLGRQLRLLGFNLDFAPVLDVGTRPDNPAIGDRSFGDEPARVIRHARAFAAGLARAGVMSCGKHFPGHGDTAVDSHFELPRVPHQRPRLTEIELLPFATLAPSLPSLMTAHIVFDALEPGCPATLSHRIVTGVLRGELGYRGMIFSDDLEMKAVSETYGIPNAACRAIEAGCDSVLICQRPDETLAAHAALVRKAEAEPAFAARLHDAAARSLSTRMAYPAQPTAAGEIDAKLAAEAPESMAARIAAARAEVQRQ